ncbi:hypothetical protein TIFTF001_035202 [Ficus carica]|uniref:Retrotransposon gag domain-containing protein n=1 Tax=Ficus carica TaxID=3494 RepID=A0AA88E555_FICCA|nr:hypothetical protein TIFTF001_035202 [Ficus carica]
MGGLRAQLAQQNLGPPGVGVLPTPVNQSTALDIPNADLWEIVQIRQDVSLMTWEDFVGEFKEKYFNTEIMEAQQDEFNRPYPPTTVAKCVSRAIRAEYWIGQDKEQWAKFFKAKKEDKAQAK